MVGKRHSASGGSAKKSPVAGEPALASRPKRNISPKCLDVTTGLSWREERELKKALYASLNDARKSAKSETSGSNSVTDGTPSKSDSSEPSTPNINIQSPYADESGNPFINPLSNGQSGSSRGQRSSSLPNIPVTKLRQLRNANQHSEANGSFGEGQCSDTPPASSTNSRSNSLDESSQDSTSRSSFSTNAPTPQSVGASSSSPPEATKAKVHAQRKFASLQNCGTAGYTCYSPSSATPPVNKIPTKTSPVQMFPKRAKTEDFLTFLCLRGTPALPPHLDFFNFTRYDGTNYMSPHKSGRESSPSSTSTSLSNFNHDETGENSRTFSPVTKHITPTKKAARASAGTPETARGLQGVRPRLTKNSLKAQSPLAKSSSKIKSQGLRKRSPPKMTRSFSVPRTVPKLGMMRRSSETNPIRLSASSKLAIKRKSETSLTSAKLTGSKVKKSLTNEADGVSQKDRTNSDNTEENKCIKTQMNDPEPQEDQRCSNSSRYSKSASGPTKEIQQRKSEHLSAVLRDGLKSKLGVTVTYADAVDALSALKIASDQNTPFLLESSENSSRSSSRSSSPSSAENNDQKLRLKGGGSVPFLLESETNADDGCKERCRETCPLESEMNTDGDSQSSCKGPVILETNSNGDNDSQMKSREPFLLESENYADDENSDKHGEPFPLESENNGENVSENSCEAPFLLESENNGENASENRCEAPFLLESENMGDNKSQTKCGVPFLLESENNIDDEIRERCRKPLPLESENNGENRSRNGHGAPFLLESENNGDDKSQTRRGAPFILESENNGDHEIQERNRKPLPLESENNGKSVSKNRHGTPFLVESENNGDDVGQPVCGKPFLLLGENPTVRHLDTGRHRVPTYFMVEKRSESFNRRCGRSFCLESDSKEKNFIQRSHNESILSKSSKRKEICQRRFSETFHLVSENQNEKISKGRRRETFCSESENKGGNVNKSRCRETLPHRDCDVHPVYLVKNVSQQQKVLPNSLAHCPLRARTSVVPKPAPPLSAYIRASSDFSGFFTNFQMGLLKRKHAAENSDTNTTPPTHSKNVRKFVSILPIQRPCVFRVPCSVIGNLSLKSSNPKPSLTPVEKQATPTCRTINSSVPSKESRIVSVEKCSVDYPVVEIKRNESEEPGSNTSTHKQRRYVSILPTKFRLIQSRTSSAGKSDVSACDGNTPSVITHVKDFNSSSQQLINIQTLPKPDGNNASFKQVITCTRSEEGRTSATDTSSGKDSSRAGRRYVSILTRPGIGRNESSSQNSTSRSAGPTLVINRNKFLKTMPNDSNNNLASSSDVNWECTCEKGFRLNTKRKWSLDVRNDSGCYPDADTEADLDASKDETLGTPYKVKVTTGKVASLIPIPSPVMSTSATQKDANKLDVKKNPRETYERKVTSVGMELRVRINLRKPRRRPASDFIAMRLPKRQAKENALKFYMESDDLENDENRSTSDEEITFPKKRKHDSGYDIDQCKIPFKKSRLKKTENRLKKSGTHGRKLLRCSKELQKLTGGNPDELAANLNDDSEGVSTRSASKNLNQKFGSRGSAAKVFANKRLQKIKEMKRKDLTKKSDSSDSEVKGKEKTQAAESNTQKVASEKEDVGLKEDNKTTKKEAPQPVKKGKGRPPGSLNKPKDGKEKKPSTLKQRGESRNLHREVSTSMTEVPTFFPTEEEFQQPIKYIQSISAMAEPFGMCKIIPPSSWKMDGKISEDVRFTTQKQYIHKMYKRFGPITEKLECIRRHLETQNTQEPMQVPTVGGVEIDLCKLSETIDKFGGMQHVIEKKKWMKVADAMNIPKLAQDRGTKLYDAYCKCLLSYNGLSTEEKEKLSVLVNAERQKVRNEEQEEDCVVKGKSMSLGAFNRVARNTTSIWTKDEQMSTEQIEREYWNTVTERGSHVVVHGGHVDTKTQNCSMFPYKRENPYSKHPWNLNNLPNHKSSLLQYLHHVSGVTVPTLHVGMLYTSSCWSTDTHHLPYVQYLHNEADIIWYCIPSQEERKFQSVMKELVPTLVSSKIRWLKEDTAMVPPEVLLQRGVHVSRCVQQPHQFVVVFPKCYTATISCGYTLAESSHYATKEWLPLGVDVAKILNKSREEELFSMEELLCNIVEDAHSSQEILQPALTEFEKIVDRELSFRKVLYEIGLKSSKRMAIATPPPRSTPGSGRRNSTDLDESITRCEISKKICFLSLVLNEAEDLALSMEQALIHLQKKKNLKTCKLLFRHTEEELHKILNHARQRLKSIQSPEEHAYTKRGKKTLQYESEFQRFIDNKAKRKVVIGQKSKVFISESNKI